MKESTDILTLLEALNNHEVFTPPRVAKQILDLLPKELWSDPGIRILDPCVKSGVFLREAYFLLDKHLAGRGSYLAEDGVRYNLDDFKQRTTHILKNMLWGIAISELTGYVSRRTLYGVMEANTDKQLAALDSFEKSSNFEDWTAEEKWNFVGRNKFNEYYDHRMFNIPERKGFESEGNIFYPSSEVARIVLEDGNYEVEDKYFPFTEERTQHPWILNIRNGEMRFDVIIGNPPYQQQDGGGSGSSAIPIYNRFIEQAKELSPRYISMIIPARWYSGGKGLDRFRESMLSDTRISHLFDYTDSRDLFPGVDVAGGICYFLWDSKYSGDCHIRSVHHKSTEDSKRSLSEFNVFIRSGETAEIVRRVVSNSVDNMVSMVSSRKPFGLEAKIRPTKGDLTLVSSGGTGPFPSAAIGTGRELIQAWKVMLSKASYDHGGQADKDGKRRIFAKVEVAPPGTVFTESYLAVGPVANEKQAKNLERYLKTKFVRFLVGASLLTQNIVKDKFEFVPLEDFNQDDLTDAVLYKKYGLSKPQIELIEASMKEMDRT